MHVTYVDDSGRSRSGVTNVRGSGRGRTTGQVRAVRGRRGGAGGQTSSEFEEPSDGDDSSGKLLKNSVAYKQ